MFPDNYWATKLCRPYGPRSNNKAFEKANGMSAVPAFDNDIWDNIYRMILLTKNLFDLQHHDLNLSAAFGTTEMIAIKSGSDGRHSDNTQMLCIERAIGGTCLNFVEDAHRQTRMLAENVSALRALEQQPGIGKS